MSTYLVLKWIHILSSTVLFGTGIGIAFFKWITDRTGDVRAIRIVSERTVLADWVFTTPAVVIQPVTGLAIAQTMGYSLRTSWILGSLLLWSPERAGFPWSGFSCRRDLARRADDAGTGLSEQYRRLNVIWFWLGVPAFSALVAVFWLMVAKPAL
jgi:uncharacterized membrane protein